MPKKADIYQYYNQNGTKLSLMYTIALLTEKNIYISAAQFWRNKFQRL